MMNKSTDFPQYRKLSNNRSYFKIISDVEFEEIQLMGTKTNKYKFTATQYPEKLKIMDMLNLEAPYLLCDANEYISYD